MEEELKTYLQAMEERLAIKIEQTETKLLTEFWKWGRTADMRGRQLTSSDAHMADQIANVSERLMHIEDRVFSLERKALGGTE